jgi:small GTP-binding protein
MDFEEKGSIKAILIGNEGVGKTNLIKVSTGGEFNEDEKTTINASSSNKTFTINKIEYNLSIWDTLGQESLRHLTKIFFKNSKIVIFVYDITSRESFEGLNSWDKDVKDVIGVDVIKGVVGNKQDLYLNEKVTETEGKNYAESIGAKFLLTSAKTDPKSFSQFLQDLLIEYLNKNEIIEQNIKLRKPTKGGHKKRKC